MCGIRSATAALLFVSLLGASSAGIWIVESDIKPEELRESSHQLLLKLLSKKSADELAIDLRNEFYTMAMRKDFYRLTADEAENKEYHAVAEACVALSQKLPYMQVVSHLQKAAVLNATLVVQKEGDVTKAMPRIKENVEKSMQQHPALYEEYKRLKSEALARPLPADYKVYYYEIPKTLDDAKKILAETLNNPYLKKMLVYSTFGNETRKGDGASALAKAVMELSTDAEIGAKVQTLFDEAVAETATKIADVEGKHVEEQHVIETFIQIAKNLFEALANKFENDPTVKTKFAETKAKFSKS